MLKFIESKPDRSMLQFIVNLLYLGMKSGNPIWAESNGTRQAVIDLLSKVPNNFIKVANNILLNGAIMIDSDRRLTNHSKICKDIEEYQDIIDVLRCAGDVGDFSEKCKYHFERLTGTFSAHEDLSVRR